MRQRGCIRAAAVLWIVGLVGFCFPFMRLNNYSGSFGLSGAALITGVTVHEEIQDSLTINGYLWVSLLAALVCIYCVEHILSRDYESWEDARSSLRPILSVIIGGLALLMLILYPNSYGNEWRLASKLGMARLGFGWGLTLVCFILAPGCVIRAYLMGRLDDITGTDLSTSTAEETPVCPAPCEDKAELIHQKLIRLQEQFLKGEITAAAYEQERRLVEKIAAELPSTSDPTPSSPPEPPRKSAHIPGPRPTKCITCPLCGNVQRPDRLVCWECGARFIFDDPPSPPELPKS